MTSQELADKIDAWIKVAINTLALLAVSGFIVLIAALMFKLLKLAVKYGF